MYKQSSNYPVTVNGRNCTYELVKTEKKEDNRIIESYTPISGDVGKIERVDIYKHENSSLDFVIINYGISSDKIDSIACNTIKNSGGDLLIFALDNRKRPFVKAKVEQDFRIHNYNIIRIENNYNYYVRYI